MATLKIDEFILDSVSPSWKKVARVVADTMAAPGLGFPEGKYVAERIGVLLKDGLLESQGDIRDWHHSEIRRPAMTLDGSINPDA